MWKEGGRNFGPMRSLILAGKWSCTSAIVPSLALFWETFIELHFRIVEIPIFHKFYCLDYSGFKFSLLYPFSISPAVLNNGKNNDINKILRWYT